MQIHIISFPVKAIETISELSSPDGTRQLDFPYFLSTESGWEIHTINERTDPEALMKLIEEGKVFIYFNLNDNQ